MQDSIAPSGTPIVPADLLELPESVVEVPPVEPRIQALPFDHLSWQDFEQVVFRVVRKNFDVVYCARYGRPGQAQDRIDVYGRLSGGGHICGQAKNQKDVRASDIENAVDDFLKGRKGVAIFSPVVLRSPNRSIQNERITSRNSVWGCWLT